MAIGNYANGLTSVTSSATLICTVDAESGGVYIYNAGSGVVYIGGGDVTASGANQGIPLAATTGIFLPTIGGVAHNLYGITASSSYNVNWIYPEAP